MRGKFFWLLGLVILVVLGACSELPPAGVTQTPLLQALPESAGDHGSRDYVLGIGDELDIRFDERPDLQPSTTYRVQPDGRVMLPHLPPIPAAGLSLPQFDARLRQVLEELRHAAGAGSYVLGSGDELEIRFTNHAALNQTVRIRPDGRITLPHVRAVRAEGKTPEEFEQELIGLYARYLKRPDLTVVVRSFSSTRVRVGDRYVNAQWLNRPPVVSLRSFAAPQIFVGGEVARPGVLNYRHNLSLLQAILEAGGYKATGEMRSVIVLRKTADTALVVRRDLRSDLSGATTNDFLLQPSDVIVVPKTLIANFAELMDQYLYQPFTFLRNTSFSFVYDINPTVRVEQ